MTESAQKYRFENEGHKPRNYVLVDIAKMDKDERDQFGARVGDTKAGAVVLLRNTRTKALAAITPEWLRGARGPGKWVPVK